MSLLRIILVSPLVLSCHATPCHAMPTALSALLRLSIIRSPPRQVISKQTVLRNSAQIAPRMHRHRRRGTRVCPRKPSPFNALPAEERRKSSPRHINHYTRKSQIPEPWNLIDEKSQQSWITKTPSHSTPSSANSPSQRQVNHPHSASPRPRARAPARRDSVDLLATRAYPNTAPSGPGCGRRGFGRGGARFVLWSGGCATGSRCCA